MRKKTLLSLLIIILIIFSGTSIAFAANYIDYTVSKTSGGNQFDFDGNYAPSELKIDGLANDNVWQNLPDLAIYGKNNAVNIKVFKGEKAIFFFFNVIDEYLLTQGNSNDDTVTEGDSVEIYLDTALDGALKPQIDDYQINLGIHGKTRIMQGAGSQWGSWNGLIDYAVSLRGTLNDGVASKDTGYSVELMIPYAQIGIEKTDAIGLSLGQVDKIAVGGTIGVDYDWYGYNFNSTFVDPQSPAKYVVLKADNTLCSKDNLEKPNAGIAGYVTDITSKIPLIGVNISVEGKDELKTTTNSNGYFELTNLSSEINYELIIVLTGYFDDTIVFTRAELRNSNGGIVTKQISLLNINDAAKTTLQGKVKNVFEGAINNATVKVNGTILSSVTDTNGEFSITELPIVGDIELLISKSGYAESSLIVKGNTLTADGVTTVGDINLSLAFNKTAVSLGGSRGINEFSLLTTRTLTGIHFEFKTISKFENNEILEFYIHAGVMTNKAFGIFLHEEGNITLRSGGIFNSTASTTSLVYKVVQNADITTGCTLFLDIPYEFLGMQSNDVFGFSGGVWGYNNTGSGDWDGFGFDGFIDPSILANYVRCDYLNNLYKASNNDAQSV